MKINFTYFYGVCSLLVLQGCKTQKMMQIEQRPNIIYVYPDQFRNSAMEFWGEEGFREKVNFRNDPVVTPNLNKFARESLVLTSAMSNNPLSSPYRGSLLTGMYPNKSGVPINCSNHRVVSSLRKDVECIAEVLGKAGYDCAYFGKEHFEHIPSAGKYANFTPSDSERIRFGFNYWYSNYGGNRHKFPSYVDTEGTSHKVNEWSPLHEAKQIAAYLRNDGNVRDSKKPFFIMLSMNPPHSPYNSLNDCMEEDYNLYKDVPLDSLLVRPNAKQDMRKAKSVPYYFASITGVDRAFGQILDTLKELDLDKNTIVVFTSDHGDTMCSHGINEPKNNPYNESMNVPFIVRFPEKIKPCVDDLILSTPDIMPTLLGMVGLSHFIPKEVQGHDYSSLFFNSKADVVRPEGALYIQNVEGEKAADGKVYTYIPTARGFKTARYTFALYMDPKTKGLKSSFLFDDVNDPYQMYNLPLRENKEIVRTLCVKMKQVLKDINDPWYTEGILEGLMKELE